MRSDAAARRVARTRARLPWLLAVGAALAIAGGAYIVWGVGQLRNAPSPSDGFDRPVAGIAVLLAHDAARLREFRAETPREETLLRAARASSDVTARLAVLLFRVIFGQSLLLLGLLLLVQALTELTWLSIVDGLRSSDPAR